MQSPSWLPRLAIILACSTPAAAAAQDGGAAPAATDAAPPPPRVDGGGVALADGATLIPPGVAIDRPGLTPAQETRYAAGLRAYQAQRYTEAIDIYTRLAQDNHCCGVLGMVVASLASTAPTAERAATAIAAADAAPNDPLRQFVAGVLAHYAAHVNGRTAEEKTRLYGQAVRYLERVREVYASEPRVWMYLALSNFRIGNQREAEQSIERAMRLGEQNPDAYIGRAEIYERANPRRAIEDIDTYLRLNAANEARGAAPNRAGVARVQAIRAHLVEVSEGRAQPQPLFDPLLAQRLAAEGHTGAGDGGPAPGTGAAPTPAAPTSTAPTRRNDTATTPTPRRPARVLGVLAVAGVAAGIWAALRARARKGGPDDGPRNPE